jgi:hypothetical protein
MNNSTSIQVSEFLKGNAVIQISLVQYAEGNLVSRSRRLDDTSCFPDWSYYRYKRKGHRKVIGLSNIDEALKKVGLISQAIRLVTHDFSLGRLRILITVKDGSCRISLSCYRGGYSDLMKLRCRNEGNRFAVQRIIVLPARQALVPATICSVGSVPGLTLTMLLVNA